MKSQVRGSDWFLRMVEGREASGWHPTLLNIDSSLFSMTQQRSLPCAYSRMTASHVPYYIVLGLLPGLGCS